MKGENDCGICKKHFFWERSSPTIKKYGIPKFCSRLCYTEYYKKELVFRLSDLSEEEKLERLKKSFEDKVIKKEGCWDWKGASQGAGYLQIRNNNKKEMAHRVSWKIHKGEIPNGLHVLHHCDNRRCTNPEHLFLGTEKDNAIDRQQKNRGQKGITHNKCKLSEEQVREIKYLLRLGLSCQSICEKFSVTNGTIWFIKEGITWKHITEGC